MTAIMQLHGFMSTTDMSAPIRTPYDSHEVSVLKSPIGRQSFALPGYRSPGNSFPLVLRFFGSGSPGDRRAGLVYTLACRHHAAEA
jgi:hypothetical protein